MANLRDVTDAPGEKWSLIDCDLRAGQRGLSGGSSLAKLLAKKRGLRNPAELPPLTEEQILEAMEASGAYRATSLSAPRGGDEQGDTLADTVGCEEHGYDLAEDRATLDRLLQTITPREREVLRLRFEEDLTQAEIGERIGVSQMQVSRLIRQSVARLRAAARAQAPEDQD